MNHYVRDISVHEDFTRGKTRNLIGRNAGIGATNPQVLWRLLIGKSIKEFWIVLFNGGDPLFVLLKEIDQFVRVV